MKEVELKRLKLLSAKIRLDVLLMLKNIGYGHLGGSLSMVELLSVLYGKHVKYNPTNPAWNERDMVVLSKGHSGPGLYSTLANVGFFDKEMLMTLNDGGTNLPSHPDRLKTPGVDMTTGSLGQGVSSAAGIATGLRKDNSDRYVYVIVGDGELNEGQCWEAFQYIANYKLNNCIVIIDDNKKQLDGKTEDIINPFDIAKKMGAFGFNVQQVQGNDELLINQALENAKKINNSAVCIVLDTIKGQGIKYFEELEANHSVKFNNEEINHATEEAIIYLREIIERGVA